MTVDSTSRQEDTPGFDLAAAQPASLLRRVSASLKWRMTLMVLAAALGSGSVTTHFLIKESNALLSGQQAQLGAAQSPDMVQALRDIESRAWLLVGAMTALCMAGAGLLAWSGTRPLTSLRHRAARMLDDTIAPGQGWPHASGEIGALAEVLRHVTLANARAMESRLSMVQQLQAILANASVGIMISRNGKFELVGRQLCQMFGYTETELIGQRTSTIYHSHEAYVELGPRMRGDLTAHGRFDGELLMRRKNGKEFWVHMLGRAVIPGDTNGGTIWILEDISQAREARDKLSWTATHDSLTGLVNRREFEARLDLAMTQFNHRRVCAMFIDLDKFKSVNDNAGHAAGDEVLRSVAAIFESAVRQSDTVGRLGGDEFAILLPGCPLERAQSIAEQVRAAVEGYRLMAEGQVFTVGTSIGLVEVTPEMPTIAAVLHCADSACYEAKRGGRNRVVTYRSDEPTPAEALMST